MTMMMMLMYACELAFLTGLWSRRLDRWGAEIGWGWYRMAMRRCKWCQRLDSVCARYSCSTPRTYRQPCGSSLSRAVIVSAVAEQGAATLAGAGTLSAEPRHQERS